MMASKPIFNITWAVSFLLGQASILWGLMVALAYNVGFGFLLPHVGRHGATGPMTGLPLELPLIGLGLGLLGLLVARSGRQPVAGSVVGYSIAGMIINTVPLILAAILVFVGMAR